LQGSHLNGERSATAGDTSGCAANYHSELCAVVRPHGRRSRVTRGISPRDSCAIFFPLIAQRGRAGGHHGEGCCLARGDALTGGLRGDRRGYWRCAVNCRDVPGTARTESHDNKDQQDSSQAMQMASPFFYPRRLTCLEEDEQHFAPAELWPEPLRGPLGEIKSQSPARTTGHMDKNWPVPGDSRSVSLMKRNWWHDRT
jgi:hypothetical protein